MVSPRDIGLKRRVMPDVCEGPKRPSTGLNRTVALVNGIEAFAALHKECEPLRLGLS